MQNLLNAIVVTLFLAGDLSAQLNFSSLDSLLSYADRNSSTSKVAEQQTLLAKWTKVAALANSVNFRNPVSFSATNNLLLPVNFIPAEAFGGPAGTFRQITLGQQYVSTFNFNPQIDIFNPYNIARAKSASLNHELTLISASITRKNHHEGIATSYYNYHGMQKQLIIMGQSLASADSLVAIMKNKLDAGIVREQDVNNSTANQLNVADKLSQLQTNIEAQANALKILCDIPPASSLQMPEPSPSIAKEEGAKSDLATRYQLTQARYSKSEWKAQRFSMLPVVSAVYYQGWQRNSNVGFSDAGSGWIESKYIGLRITMPIPPDATKLSQSYAARVSFNIASINSEHARIQDELGNRNLTLEKDKALASYNTAVKISELKQRNYNKSLEQFKEGLLPADVLLNAFNDLLGSKLNEAAAWSAFEISSARININNSIR